MKKVSLIKQQELLQHAIQELKALGFIKSENRRYDYYKQTDVGELCLTPVSDSNGLCLFGMFDDVELAKTKFNCNPCSGKYNFLFLKSKFEISDTLCQYLK